MNLLQSNGFADYELLDSGLGKRLERFGPYKLCRPDPQALWQPTKPLLWENLDAEFVDKWVIRTAVPKKWLMHYKTLSFWAKLSPFKHTGVFPEQHLQWDFIENAIASGAVESQPSILNLFAYTGVASLAAAAAGAKVTHIDGSYPTIGWARENQEASKLQDKSIRYILDDALKFCEREVRRGAKYEGIIMDPPVYGHGPKGEKWDFNTHFPKLLAVCKQLLSDKPLFIIVNAYAISASSEMLKNCLEDLHLGGTIESGELALQQKDSERLLSTGIYARWSHN